MSIKQPNLFATILLKTHYSCPLLYIVTFFYYPETGLNVVGAYYRYKNAPTKEELEENAQFIKGIEERCQQRIFEHEARKKEERIKEEEEWAAFEKVMEHNYGTPAERIIKEKEWAELVIKMGKEQLERIKEEEAYWAQKLDRMAAADAEITADRAAYDLYINLYGSSNAGRRIGRVECQTLLKEINEFSSARQKSHVPTCEGLVPNVRT